MGAAPKQAVVDFLKRRYASAICRGDNRTATRLRSELDRLINGSGGRSGHRPAQAGERLDLLEGMPELPELPPAA